MSNQLCEPAAGFVASFTQDNYRQFMQHWETRLNRYLLRTAGGHPPL